MEEAAVAERLAAEEYERLLGIVSSKFLGQPLPPKNRVWEIRNKVVHPSGKRAEREEVDVMIDIIQRICVPREKSFRAKAKTFKG